MINKSENIAVNAMTLNHGSSSSANGQSMMGNLVGIGNAPDTSMAALPLEMVYHIGSFLKLKDKVSFSQALIDAGLSVSLDEGEILYKFRDQLLTQKINILLGGKIQYYDFSKFYAADAQSEEAENLYSFLFNEMCEDFKKRKALSEEIVALVESIEAAAFVMRADDDEVAIDPEFLDGARIQAYLDRIDSNEPKDTKAFIDYLFPNLTNVELRKEIEERVEEFDIRSGLPNRGVWVFEPAEVLKAALKFIKMEAQYRGIPIKVAARTQKLASSHLQPIIQNVSEKMQTMPTEALRAWVIMATDKHQIEDFCGKMIEIGAKDNPFYAIGSPYYHMLKHDLLHRMELLSVDGALPYGNPENKNAYIYHVAYHADDNYLRQYMDILMAKFLEIQVKNGEDPVNESQPKAKYPFISPYYGHIGDFFRLMEEQYEMAESLRQAYWSVLPIVRGLTPEPSSLDKDSAERLLSSYVRNDLTFDSLMRILRANPHYINAQDVNGDTLLHLSIKIDSNMVETIASLNGDPNIKNAQGLTPLMLATQLENMELLNALLKLPSLDMNKCDHSGNTALHHAILANKKMAMHRLLRHEATDKTLANTDGKTARELAESLGLLSLYDALNQA